MPDGRCPTDASFPIFTEIKSASLKECAERLADDISARLRDGVSDRGRATLAVSGGRTPEHIFPLLAEKDIAWERIDITLTDERWVDPEDQDSNENLARRFLMRGPASAARFIGLKTDHETPFGGREVCDRAMEQLQWPLDALFLGMGEDGHIASLFPGTQDWISAPGRTVAVGASADRQPRMSLTPGALLDSRHIYLVITGPEKRATFEAARSPGSVGEFPVRLILQQDKLPVSVYTVD